MENNNYENNNRNRMPEEPDNRNSNKNNGNGGNNNNKGNGSGGFWTFLLMGSIFLFLIFTMFRTLIPSDMNVIEYSEFVRMIESGEVSEVVIGNDRITIVPVKEEGTINNPFLPKDADYLYTGKVEEDETLTARLLENNIKVSGEIPDNSGEIWYFLLTTVLPIGLMVILTIMLIRKISKSGGMGGFMSVGKNNAKVYAQKETGITFKDVAGEDEAIESLQEVVDFLHNPDRYVKIGARLPKGALLVGPPGTGKTLLAKAVAGEAKVPFFSLTGSDFVELYVGVGASRVRDLFQEAEKNAPCIIFIDEIDAIGRSRDSKYGGGNEEREQTLNQLLAEMDGFDGKKGIIILAATNRPEILDKALLRPGRFDRRIIVEKPDLKGRVEILKVHAKDVLMDETVDLEEIALATSGAVGSDLANMINEAAINAVKNKREYVSQKDLFNAVEIVLVGKEKKDRILSEQERRIVSYHEVGHALVSALQKNSEPVQKITIVPRTMGALGYVMHVPEEEKYLNSEAELKDMLVGLLAGRAAEELVFDSVTTGASNDIEKATSIARSMVTQYGMSDKFGLIGLETVESRYLDGRVVMNCADVTAAAVDEEVMRILKESYAEATNLLKDNREIMDKLAEYLIQKETITGKEFMEIYCKEKGIPVPEPKAESMRKNKKVQEEAEAQEAETEEKSEAIEGVETAEVATTETEDVTKDTASQAESAEVEETAEIETTAENDGETVAEEESHQEEPKGASLEDVQDDDDSEDGDSDSEDSTSETSSSAENDFAKELKKRIYK